MKINRELKKNLLCIAIIITQLETLSVVAQDLQDDSILEEGHKPTIHEAYGPAVQEVIYEIIPQHFVDSRDQYTLEEIYKDIDKITGYYKDMTEGIEIGRSYEDRPIYAIKVGVKTDEEKPSILLLGGIHAREDFSVTLNMKMMDYILYSYYDSGQWGEYNVIEILEEINIYFVPILNPDGLNIAHNGIKASTNYEYLKTLPNKAGDDRWWKANGRGVDLNGNFDDGNWVVKYTETSSKVPASEGYKGDFPNSEMETQAIQKFVKEVKPLMAISYHTSGEIMYWADIDTHHIFNGIDDQVTTRLSNITGYTKKEVSKNRAIFGAGFENWFKKVIQRFAICMELSPKYKDYVQHEDSKFDSLVWSKAKFTGLELARSALLYKDKYYDVYQGDRLLKTFYDEVQAIRHAQLFENAKVMTSKGLIWESSR